VVNWSEGAIFTTRRSLAVPDRNPEPALTTVAVTGPVTRVEAGRWRDAFVAPLAHGRGLRIDLAESGPWDLAGVQLLLAAIVLGRRTGAPIVLAGVPNVLRTVAERAGLLDQLAPFFSGA
jgi:ABC-type transporter Mla MlaB component